MSPHKEIEPVTTTPATHVNPTPEVEITEDARNGSTVEHLVAPSQNTNLQEEDWAGRPRRLNGSISW